MTRVLGQGFLFGVAAAAIAMGPAAQELEQDPIVIKGEQGLPKTLYIAPWKRVGGPLEAGPLQGGWEPDDRPLERELFLRELELRDRGISVDRPAPSKAPSPAGSSPGPGY